MSAPRYDGIGRAYAQVRREDPRLRDRIHSLLAGSRTVVNVGAGAGSYEPRDRRVIAVEPSAVMIAQRPADLGTAIRATAGALPLRDDGVDAALAILTLHHWDDQLASGVRELRRVARGPVVIVTYDPSVSAKMWLMRDYLPEAAALDHATFPTLDRLEAWLGGSVEAEAILTPRDTPDWTLGAFWAHPERVLDESARRATSAFARMEPEVVDRVVAEVERDLRTGAWGRRNRDLEDLEAFDAGMRLVVARA